MKFASSRTILAATFVAAVSIALPLQGVAAGAAVSVALPLQGISAGAAVPHPQLLMRQTMSAHGPLTKAEIFKLAGYANQHVIVVLKNQFTRLDGRARRQLATRDAAVAAAERPVLAELRAVHARHVLAFHLIDAIKATVTPAELTHLQSEPEVRAVVPNAEIRAPRTVMLAPVTAARIRTAAAGCDSNKSTPVLQPEALMLTHTAYQNPKTPQAQNLVTGKGVTVAIISGPIDRQNPDFLRADGSQVITSYVNFTGDAPNLAGGGGGADGESFIDMSSVGSQGNEVFNLNDWAHNLGRTCSYIRILGMAPGASVMWEDTYGQHGSTTAEFVQA
ncbi:MAG TPA: hypothetical protein VG815_02810, partial [Chloroflexota bacterium]|nr:hypothetical protein [Chloroflexota bacterium]